jgi:hypothetical protein
MGRHQEQRRRLSPTTWVAGLAGLAVVGAIALAMAPANAAATTVDAQLTLSGVAYSDQPTGGSTVGVHPGDSVHFTSAAIPTAGAPSGLSSVLSGLVGGVAGLQVKITSGNLPGVSYPYLLGTVSNCPGGHSSLALNSLAKGTYNFKYVVEKISLLTGLLGKVTGCKTTQITPSHDQLGALTKDNVKVSDTATYSGSVVVASDPPKGTIGAQLPQQSVSVKAGPIHTSVTLPGATLGVPNPLPSITGKLGSLLPKGGKKSTPASSKKSTPASIKYTPPALTVPEQVMPHAVNYGGGGGGTGFAAPGGGSGGGNGGGYVAPAPQATTTAAPAPTATAEPVKAAKTVDVAQKQTLGGAQLPVLLAILAVLALASVTGMYAKMYLLRKPSA